MVRDPKDLDGRPLGASSGTSGVRGVGVTGPIWTTMTAIVFVGSTAGEDTTTEEKDYQHCGQTSDECLHRSPRWRVSWQLTYYIAIG